MTFRIAASKAVLRGTSFIISAYQSSAGTEVLPGVKQFTGEIRVGRLAVAAAKSKV